MALSVAVRSFAWTTAQVATTAIDVDFGFTPKVLFGFSTHKLNVDGPTTSPTRGGARVSFAATKSAGGGTAMSANRRAICFESVDNASTGDYRGRTINSAFATVGGSTGTLDIDAEANWPANNVRFIVDVQNAVSDQRITVIALGGTDVSDATVGTITEPASTGAQGTTGVGFQPTCLLLASIGNATENSGGVTSTAFMLGAGDGTRSFVHALGGDNGNTTMDTVAYMKSSQIVALMPAVVGVTIDAEASLTSLDSDGFTLNWSSRAGSRKLFYLAIKLASTSFSRVDTTTTATNTSNFSVTGYGGQPQGAFFLSASRAESTATTPTAHGQVSFGAAESTTVREAQAMFDRDAVGTSECSTDYETDAVYSNLDTAGAVQGLMDLVSFDSDGMTLVMDDADPAASVVGVLAFGATSTAGAGDQASMCLMGVQ